MKDISLMLIFLKGIIWFLQDSFFEDLRFCFFYRNEAKVCSKVRKKNAQSLVNFFRVLLNKFIANFAVKYKIAKKTTPNSIIRIRRFEYYKLLLALMHCVGCINFVLPFFDKENNRYAT